MRQEQLTEIFEIINSENPSCLLSGSLALELQNIKLPRVPTDIDIYLPYGEVFKQIEGMRIKDAVLYLDEEKEYLEEEYYITSFHYGGRLKGVYSDIKIDIFQPEKYSPNELLKVYCNEIPCVYYKHILKFKFSHALNNTNKHAEDLTYILANNSNYKTQKEISPQDVAPYENVTPSLNLTLSRPIIFFDTETTGVDRIKDRIVELSTTKYFPNGEVETKTQLFNPTIPIPASASEVHGITDADVRDKPTFASKAAELVNYFRDCDLAGYNIIDFDVPLIVEEFLRANVSLPFDNQTKFLDAIKIFYINERRDLTSAYKFYCHKDLKDAHSAEADVTATIEVLNSQVKRYKLAKTIDELHTICNDGNEIIDYERKFTRNEEGEIVFSFGKYKGQKANIDLDYLTWMLSADFSNYTKLIIRKIIRGEINVNKPENEVNI